MTLTGFHWHHWEGPNRLELVARCAQTLEMKPWLLCLLFSRVLRYHTVHLQMIQGIQDRLLKGTPTLVFINLVRHRGHIRLTSLDFSAWQFAYFHTDAKFGYQEFRVTAVNSVDGILYRPQIGRFPKSKRSRTQRDRESHESRTSSYCSSSTAVLQPSVKQLM